MAENLNFAASNSKCGNNNSLSDSNTTSCDTYGRLYNWATAMNGSAGSDANPSKVQGVCPAGWHIPSDVEWSVLETAVGDSSTAGTKLKAASRWNSSGNGTDNYGFSALPGGYAESGGFIYVGNSGYWWSASEYDRNYAYRRRMGYDDSNVFRNRYDKSVLYSVRCVQD